MPKTITTIGEFREAWTAPPNFRISHELYRPDFTFPSALEVLDVVRRDDEARVTLLGADNPAVRTARTMSFKRAPVEEVATWPFRLAHFNLSRLYDGVLRGFHEQVMVPWRTFLSAQGYTWQRCAPDLFISGPGGSSTYHADQSHGLVWQVEGVKTFHSYLDPDSAVPADAAISGDFTAEDPPPHDDADRQDARMEPGDLLWSHFLTPHWVTGESPLSMSVTLSHGGLTHQGDYAMRETALRRHWDRHPEQAWLTDLRNTRY
ncbi:hypothetical protein [Streptomyces sp. NPDC008092]|uniref:hypothetical protein n=1 Tax=Streptomyces sp. NPDC008092 TaxID=3364808 RepID=UPI0036E485B3